MVEADLKTFALEMIKQLWHDQPSGFYGHGSFGPLTFNGSETAEEIAVAFRQRSIAEQRHEELCEQCRALSVVPVYYSDPEQPVNLHPEQYIEVWTFYSGTQFSPDHWGWCLRQVKDVNWSQEVKWRPRNWDSQAIALFLHIVDKLALEKLKSEPVK